MYKIENANCRTYRNSTTLENLLKHLGMKKSDFIKDGATVFYIHWCFMMEYYHSMIYYSRKINKYDTRDELIRIYAEINTIQALMKPTSWNRVNFCIALSLERIHIFAKIMDSLVTFNELYKESDSYYTEVGKVFK